MTGRVRIASICGSLRAQSVNAAVLAEAQRLAPTHVELIRCDLLDQLPHFNPDLDRNSPPPAAQRLREELRRSDAALFSTSEYAGSLPGSFKNLLDWTVSGASFYRLPVGRINPSSHGGARDASHALRLVLDKTGAQIVNAVCADIPVRTTR